MDLRATCHDFMKNLSKSNLLVGNRILKSALSLLVVESIAGANGSVDSFSVHLNNRAPKLIVWGTKVMISGVLYYFMGTIMSVFFIERQVYGFDQYLCIC